MDARPVFTSDCNVAAFSNLDVAIAAYVDDFGRRLKICVPVIVKEDYDSKKDLVKVQCVVKRAYGKDKAVAYEEFEPFKVHPFHFAFGSFHLVTPIKKGMTGWVISADRDPTKAREENGEKEIGSNKGPSLPTITTMGLYEKGFFVPDRWFKDASAEYRKGFGDYVEQTGLRLNDKKIGLFLSEEGVLTIVNNDESEKKLKIDLSAIDKTDSIELREMWLAEEVSGSSVKFVKRIVLCGETNKDSKTMQLSENDGKKVQIS